MNKTLPTEAAAFPESPRLTRRHLFNALAVTAAFSLPFTALAQNPRTFIRSMRSMRSVTGNGTDVIIEVVSDTPFHVGALGWILRIGDREFGDYNYGPRGELTILQYRVPAAEFGRLASGKAASVHYGGVNRPGRSLGKFNRSLLGR